jgi:hypothetical protein
MVWTSPLVLAVALAWSGPALAQSARELNAKGYQAYKQKKYDVALDHFKRAVEADRKYALARFNLACTLGVLRKLNKVCEHDAYKSTIVEHLRELVKLDRSWREKIQKDDDLKPVHDTFGFQTLIGLDPTRTADVQLILQRVTWYGTPQGVLGPVSGLSFKAGGKLQYWSVNEAEGPARRERINGTYTVEGAKVRIRLGKPVDGKQAVDGVLGKDGLLRVPGLDERGYSDDSGECGA